MLIKLGLIIIFGLFLLSCGSKRTNYSEDVFYHWVTHDRCFIKEKVNYDISVSRDDLILYFNIYWYRFTFEKVNDFSGFENIKVKSIIDNELIFRDNNLQNRKVQGLKLTKQINSTDLIYCNSNLQNELFLIKELTFSETDMSESDMTNIIVSIIKREISALKKYPYRIRTILVDSKQYLNLVLKQLKIDFIDAEQDLFMKILEVKKNGKYLKVKIKTICGVRCGGIKEYTLKRVRYEKWQLIHIRNLIYF